jgi:hypothetical protein
MNSLFLVVWVSCPLVAAWPDAGPAPGGSTHQGRPRLFRWLRRHHHENKYPRAGNGNAVGRWQPVAAAPAVEAGTVGAVPLEPAPPVVPPPACHCAGNGNAVGRWQPVAAAPAPAVEAGTVGTVTLKPAPPVVPPPATAGPAPRLVPRPQPVTTSAEPPFAAPADDAPRQMPRGPVATTGAEPPGN